MSAPQWAPVDDDTADLLTVLADDGSAIPSPQREWDTFVYELQHVALFHDGLISPNDLRPRVRGKVKPSRIGAFTRRAQLEHLVEYTGEWQVSDDTESGNAGKPSRVMRWLGGIA